MSRSIICIQCGSNIVVWWCDDPPSSTTIVCVVQQYGRVSTLCLATAPPTHAIVAFLFQPNGAAWDFQRLTLGYFSGRTSLIRFPNILIFPEGGLGLRATLHTLTHTIGAINLLQLDKPDLAGTWGTQPQPWTPPNTTLNLFVLSSRTQWSWHLFVRVRDLTQIVMIVNCVSVLPTLPHNHYHNHHVHQQHTTQQTTQ